MKECMIEGCHKKHHAKGYCKLHYTEYILKKRLENEKCSVPGCQNCVSYSFTKEKLCDMHGTRLKRNGSVEIRQRERNIKSLIKAIVNSESPLDYEMANNNSFSEISKLYYGDYCHECGWDKGNCVAHHLKKRSEGGKNTLRNAIVLCPNCHSLKHKNYIKRFSTKYKQELIDESKKIK